MGIISFLFANYGIPLYSLIVVLLTIFRRVSFLLQLGGLIAVSEMDQMWRREFSCSFLLLHLVAVENAPTWIGIPPRWTLSAEGVTESFCNRVKFRVAALLLVEALRRTFLNPWGLLDARAALGGLPDGRLFGTREPVVQIVLIVLEVDLMFDSWVVDHEFIGLRLWEAGQVVIIIIAGGAENISHWDTIHLASDCVDSISMGSPWLDLCYLLLAIIHVDWVSKVVVDPHTIIHGRHPLTSLVKSAR